MTVINLTLYLTSLLTSMAVGDIYGSICAMLSLISLGLEKSRKFRTFNLTPLNQHQGRHITANISPKFRLY